jgi:Ca2+-binding EF-hand superfamily protein
VTPEDIKEKKKYWEQIYPSGVATRKNFGLFAKKVSVAYDEDSIDFMFRAMDADRDGRITFEYVLHIYGSLDMVLLLTQTEEIYSEFLWYMAITSPSNQDNQAQMDELIDMCFLMYDEDGNGILTRDELTRTLQNVFKTQGHDINDPEVKRNIEHRINKLFKICDANRDGVLTKDEIKNACRRDPTIVDLL